MAMEWITAIDKRYANCFSMFLSVLLFPFGSAKVLHASICETLVNKFVILYPSPSSGNLFTICFSLMSDSTTKKREHIKVSSSKRLGRKSPEYFSMSLSRAPSSSRGT